ncbi:MAG: acetate--CoA ligase [Actinomycetota bacterium]|nr:acetate--CoA ligase [Actinomycetota bacterium]
MSSQTLENLSHEDRSFPPDPAFTAQANGTQAMYDAAAADYEGFWGDQARSRISWSKDFTKVLDWSNAPFATWFEDGELNAAYNCVDRHVEAGNGDRVAIHFVGEPEGDTRDITYAELQGLVMKAANVLTDLGVEKGDPVAIYLPMIPEAAVAMLACARIGAPHSVVFGGFSSEALNTRIQDAGCKVVITADGGYRRGAPSALKPAVDAALAKAPTGVEHVLVVKRTGQDVDWTDVDIWWDDAMDKAAETHVPMGMEAEHPLFILYTSGTTGKPKGIFHTTGGYLTQVAYTNSVVHDVHPESDVYWCTADIGWVTGHSYIVYGPLQNHTTGVIYEGAPEHPSWSRHWEIVQKHKVTIYYTAPTAIRALVGAGDGHLEGYDLSSLRLLGTVGEPINPEAWMWYHDRVGGGRCPIVDTWWQTETGSILISPLPGVTPTKPGSATLPLPGIAAEIVNEIGEAEPRGGGGYLVLKRPWPSMLRTFYGEDERYVETYWSRFGPRVYFTGDGAKTDEDGYFWLLGRVDDVINVAGHRISTGAMEEVLASHPAVAECAVIGVRDAIKGELPCGFVVLKSGVAMPAIEVEREIVALVRERIGPVAALKRVFAVDRLPKTRSGKILRGTMRSIADGEPWAMPATVEDPASLHEIERVLGRVS